MINSVSAAATFVAYSAQVEHQPRESQESERKAVPCHGHRLSATSGLWRPETICGPVPIGRIWRAYSVESLLPPEFIEGWRQQLAAWEDEHGEEALARMRQLRLGPGQGELANQRPTPVYRPC